MLERELPDVLEPSGGGARPLRPDRRRDAATIDDRSPREGDERFVTYTGRRSTIEWAISRAAEAEPGVEIRRGVGVTALETQRLEGRVHVTAVRTDAGDRLAGELIVDAMGRGSALPKLLAAAGGAAGRRGGRGHRLPSTTPASSVARRRRSRPDQCPVGTFSILTLPGDNGTWSVTLYASAGDRPLKAMRHADTWTAVVGACPRHAHWLDGEPITPVLPMGGVVDRVRSLNGNGAGAGDGV